MLVINLNVPIYWPKMRPGNKVRTVLSSLGPGLFQNVNILILGGMEAEKFQNSICTRFSSNTLDIYESAGSL